MTGRSGSTERLFDVALGLSFLAWAVMGLRVECSPPRVVVSALNVTLAVLFLVRRSAAIHTTPRAVLLALPSLACGGAALTLSSPLSEWGAPRVVLFGIAAAGAIGAMLTLGRCFAVFPSLRGVVARGPFRCVRHPTYLCELGMIAVCARSVWGILVAIVTAGAIVVRIREEERVLSRSHRYRAYARRVRWRLLPGVW